MHPLPRGVRRPIRFLFDERPRCAVGLRRRPPGHRPGLRDHPWCAVGIPSTTGRQPARGLRPAREELRERDAQPRGGAVTARVTLLVLAAIAAAFVLGGGASAARPNAPPTLRPGTLTVAVDI